MFRLERWILRLLVSRPSTDAQVRQLAQGERDSFAAWSVEARAPDQLLLADFMGRTRSWLMVAAPQEGDSAGTRLFFGTAIVPMRNPVTGWTGIGFAFRAMLGFHKMYSRILLKSAAMRLSRRPHC